MDTIQTIVTAQLLQALLDGMHVDCAGDCDVCRDAAHGCCGGSRSDQHGCDRGTATRRDEFTPPVTVAAKADALFLENTRAARAIKLFGKESVRTSVWRNKFVELMNSPSPATVF